MPLHLLTDRSHEEQPIREIYWRFIKRTLLPFEQYDLSNNPGSAEPFGCRGRVGGGGGEGWKKIPELVV